MSDNEALRLADALEFPFAAPSVKEQHAAADELRRLAAVEAELDALLALVARFIQLCALGDVDETTEALGWGELIAEAKSAVSSAKGGGNG